MSIDFAPSERSLLGIEWEIACVDRTSGELAPAAPEILAKLGRASGFPHVTEELLTNTVELVSAPHRRAKDAVAELTTMVRRIADISEPLGVALMAAGTHPSSQWFRQEVTPGSPRYNRIIERTQWWGRQMMIWGVHVHVGIEDRRKVLPIIAGLLTYLPHFQALSASSPFWAGEKTGYASNRPMLFQQLPTAGLPPQMDEWSDYEHIIDDLIGAGVIEESTQLHWDIRPSPKWGTIEVRGFDSISTAREIGAIGALTQCLVEHLSSELDAGREIERLQPWFVRENKWRAARYGMDARVIRNPAGEQVVVSEDLLTLVETLTPAAERLGCLDELDGVRGIVRNGASYQRQLRVADENDGSLKSVVASLVAELRDATGETPLGAFSESA
ncbi:glutamate--cysteine ligase [Okibacterium endophyticum]